MAVIAYPLDGRRNAGLTPRGVSYLQVVRPIDALDSGSRAPVVTILRPARARHAGRARLRRLGAVVGLGAAAVALWISLGALGSLQTRAPIALAGVRPVAGGYAYTVRPGDSIWSIATAMSPRADPRPLMDEIEARLDSATVYPGEHIVIPTP